MSEYTYTAKVYADGMRSVADFGERLCDGCARPIPTECAACGRPAEGFAMVDDRRYCHPDDGPSCYMESGWA